ncbi:MAG: glycosyltransferase [Butyrivibrio sp.]|nr:glycosyltransferase [Butyrivibrio sp.]
MNAHIEDMEKESKKSFILRAGAFEQEGSSIDEYAVIIEGLRAHYDNYELYFMLGLYYRYRNANLSYLCFENALHYCDEEEDENVIKNAMEGLADRTKVRNTSIVIVSYNDFELMRECIRAIRRYQLEEITEIIVVDNASSDEDLLDYLRQQADADEHFTLIENEKNVGFPAGCNIGLAAASPENDVFFLNNDAVLMPNSLFWLKMGLYSDKRNGVAGAVSNSASAQEVSEKSIEPYIAKAPMTSTRMLGAEDKENDDPRWWRSISLDSALEISKSYAKDHNVPMWNPVEVRCRLTGFALLIKREVIGELLICSEDKKEKRMLFDERFTPGYFEDDDLGMRMGFLGYRQVLCHNSFIFHYGGSGFSSNAEEIEDRRSIFSQKWGFDIWNYTLPEEDKINALLVAEKERKIKKLEDPEAQKLLKNDSAELKIYNRDFRILDLSAGLGATLSFIKYMAPDCYTAGITPADAFAALSCFMADDIISGNPELVTFPWPMNSFDYILAGDVITQASDPEKLIRKLESYLREDGRII